MHRLNQKFIFYAIVSIFAFCSITYELILAQSLSITLGNSILRFSFTIGLYLFSLGLGSLLSLLVKKSKEISILIKTELALSLTGILLPWTIFFGDFYIRFFSQNTSLLWTYQHKIVLIVGILSGFEIPLLISLASERFHDEMSKKILGVDYLFTFVGSLFFPFVIYPKLGIVAGSALTGGLNAFATCLFISIQGNKSSFKKSFILSLLLFFASLFILWNESYFREYISTHAIVGAE